MTQMNIPWLTSYAWVGFQYAKCKHYFLHWEVRVNNLCMCSWSVCCLSHTVISLWSEKIAGAMSFQVLQVTAQAIPT